MKKLLCLMGGLMLMMNLCGQRVVDQFLIGSDVPDLQLSRIINYKDSTATLSSFGEKMIIIDFWGTHCGPCIASFPLMDSIQRLLKDKVQFILITLNSKEIVEPFLQKWNKNHKNKLSIPIIYGEVALQQLFAHQGIPHMVFIKPNGRIITQSSDKHLLNLNLIDSIATEGIRNIEDLKSHGFPESSYKMKAPTQALIKRLSDNKFVKMKFIY